MELERVAEARQAPAALKAALLAESVQLQQARIEEAERKYADRWPLWD